MRISKTYLMILALSPLSVSAADSNIISSCSDLLAIENNSTKTYILESDIDCYGYELSEPIMFRGHLLGNSHTISGLSIKSNNRYLGLFSHIPNGYIADLTLNDFKLESTYSSYTYAAGFLAGYLENGNIDNVVIQNSITVNQPEGLYGIGSLAGRVSGTRLYNVSSINNQIDTTDQSKKVGGLVGWMEDGAWSNRASVLNNNIVVKNEKYGSGDIGGVYGRLDDSEAIFTSITATTINDSDNGKSGYNGLVVGRMFKSYLSNAEIINTSGNFRPHATRNYNGIAAGFIAIDEESAKNVLENISTNDAAVSLPWFTYDSKKPEPLTTNLYFDDTEQSTLPPDICRL
ncbi:hypothetical protein [Photobacterium minamisatsumaniensis]|uniref:hypothetical protein n=1 Tax=Photobacterium minamisatsumaniensis TaxID=2910233 RepID=UPI003D123D4C